MKDSRLSGGKQGPRLNMLSRFILIIFFVLVLPTAAITWIFSSQLQSIWQERVEESLGSGANTFVAKLSTELANLKARASTLGKEAEFVAFARKEASGKGTPGGDGGLEFLYRSFESSILLMSPDSQVIRRFGTGTVTESELAPLIVRMSVYGYASQVYALPEGLRLLSVVPLMNRDGVFAYLVLTKNIDRLGIESMRLSSNQDITLIHSADSSQLYTTLANVYGEPYSARTMHSHRVVHFDTIGTELINGTEYYTIHRAFPKPEGSGLVLEISIRHDRIWVYDTTQPLVVIMCLVLVLVVLSSVMLTHSIISPVVSLNLAVEDMRRQVNQFGLPVRIPVRNNDEIGDLARTINELGAELRSSGEKIAEQRAQIIAYTQSLEERVRERTRELDEARVRAEIANKHKSRFLVNLNHELRTPLNSITGTTDLLRFGAYERHEELALSLESALEAIDSGVPALAPVKDDLRSLVEAIRVDSNYPRSLVAFFRRISGPADLVPPPALEALQEAANLAEEEERGVFRAYNTIKDAGDALLSLIDEIINLSRIESGVIHLQKRPVRIAELLQSCMVHAESYARSKGKFDILDFKPVIAPDVPDVFMMDLQKIKQVLLNLLTNAVKYTDQGSVTCTLDLVGHNGQPFVRFTVADTGRGIPPEDRAVLFHEFGRSFEVREIEGTGLGLALSKRLVERHGGEMDFTSAMGKGSSFWFTLPLETAEGTDPGT